LLAILDKQSSSDELSLLSWLKPNGSNELILPFLNNGNGFMNDLRNVNLLICIWRQETKTL
jgi:hypothetical protein